MDQPSSARASVDPSVEASVDVFLAEIEAFLQRARMSPSGFGRAAFGDPNFVRDLRGGRAPSLRLVDRARAFMAARAGAAKASAAA
jgi:hypothetical protein